MAAILSLLPWGPVPASEFPAFEAGGLLFGDLYHVASHHSAEGDGATGLVLRRGYLTFDATFSDAWFGRLRFEVNQAGEFETYSFEAQTKDLHIGRKLGRHKVLLGLSPTLTFDLVESIWGLRYLARTPMDLQGVPSRDTGLSLQGPLNASGSLGYRAMYAAAVDLGSDRATGPATGPPARFSRPTGARTGVGARCIPTRTGKAIRRWNSRPCSWSASSVNAAAWSGGSTGCWNPAPAGTTSRTCRWIPQPALTRFLPAGSIASTRTSGSHPMRW
jgi:hypothetical protein